MGLMPVVGMNWTLWETPAVLGDCRGLDVTLSLVSCGPIPCSHTVFSTLNLQKVLFNVFSFQAIPFVLFLSLM